MIFIEVALLIVIGVLLFELIIFIHEGAHCLTAKIFKVKVNEFALGMGPKIFKFKIGETLYSLRLFPIGGFCSMEGEDDESEDERSFHKASVWKRMIIVSAGAIMNVILGFVMMLILLAPQPFFASNTIAVFTENATSSQQLHVGDEFLYVNGYRTLTSTDLSFALSTAKENSLEISVLRDGKRVDYVNVVLPTVKQEDGTEILQRDFKVLAIENNVPTLLKQTFLSTVSTVRMIWKSLIGLVTGQFSFKEVSGPIGMTSAVSQATASGLEHSFMDGLANLFYFMMIITVNLGVVNLLPLPALDGGRLIFLFVEAIRRKPIKPEHEAYVHAAGLLMFFVFTIVISIKDIIQLFT